MEDIYKKIITDVAMEISIAREWRRKIFENQEDDILEISDENEINLPDYVKETIVKNKLTFCVQIDKDCPEVEKKQEILYTNIQTMGLFGISFYAEKRRFA